MNQQRSSFQDLWSQVENESKPQSGKFEDLWAKVQSEERGPLEKAGRIGTQYGLGILQSTPAGIAYETSVAPLASKSAMAGAYRTQLSEDLDQLMDKKALVDTLGFGKWTEEDQKEYDRITDLIQNPEKLEQFAQPIDISLRSLTEKATGVNLEPEGILEKVAQWAGWIKKPENVAKLGQIGLKPKEVINALMPTLSETFRGLAAGTAIQMAENYEFGPIGTLAAGITTDLAAHGVAGLAGATAKIIKNPKEFLAKRAAKLVPSDVIKLQQNIIKDFREAGLQADLGTLTDSNIVKMVQAKVAQSGLTGEAAQKFKEELTDQIVRQYSELADNLGAAKFANEYEAGTVAKQAIKDIRDADLSETRELYDTAMSRLTAESKIEVPTRLISAIKAIEKTLTPGKLKSAEQSKVLDVIDKIKGDLYETNSLGKSVPKEANVQDLVNNKIALNDLINYEVQGGTKQLLKGIVGELDRAIISHGKTDPVFAKAYVNANKRFAGHAKMFRNREVSNLLRQENPEQLLNKMNTIHGIRQLGKIFERAPQYKPIFDSLKRMKLDQTIGKNLVDGTTKQVKLGTFSNLLEKGNNRNIVKELLGPKGFQRLERLQRNAGKLAESATKFYNTSQSAVAGADAAIIYAGISGFASLLMGNPWPLMKTTGGVIATRKMSNLMFDKEFLRLTEEAILAAGKAKAETLPANAMNKFYDLLPYLKPYVIEAKQQSQQDQSL